MENIIRLHVPSQIIYTGLVEDFMRSLGTQLFPDDEISRDNLSTVMNEVFTNIVKHSDTAKLDGTVRFQVEIDSGNLKISIYDHGPGIKVNDEYPPYPPSLVGFRHKFRQVLDGAVYLEIIDPKVLSFSFEQDAHKTGQSDNLKHLKGHGLGISIMTKIMDSVVYVLRDDGQFDWQLTKKLL